MNGVSIPRLYVLRAVYLLLAVLLAIAVGRLNLIAPEYLERTQAFIMSERAAVSLLALVGIRYPLQMLPLLLLELISQLVWVLAIGFWSWSAGSLTATDQETWYMGLGIIVFYLLVIPWGYVFDRYVRRPGDPWRRGVPETVGGEPGLGY